MKSSADDSERPGRCRVCDELAPCGNKSCEVWGKVHLTVPPESPGQAHAKELLDQLKPTNPKDAIGCDKLPLHLWPPTATVLGALALLDGALKYGRANFRAVGVRASIYIDAAMRHLMAYFEGQDTDPDSGLPHLAHALACIAILVDADAAGKLNDDRQFAGGYLELVGEMTQHVKRLKAKHADKHPRHYTIGDNEDE